MESAASYAGTKAVICGSGTRAAGAMNANAATLDITRQVETISSLRPGGASISMIRFRSRELDVIRLGPDIQ